jgi:hypothetical protein
VRDTLVTIETVKTEGATALYGEVLFFLTRQVGTTDSSIPDSEV